MKMPTHLARPLPVDLEDEVFALLQRRGDDPLRGSVAVAVHFGAFEEFAPLAQGEERALVDEVVVDPVLLAGTRRARGVGDRELEGGVGAHQGVDQRGFSGARRRRDHEQAALAPIQCSAPARAPARPAA